VPNLRVLDLSLNWLASIEVDAFAELSQLLRLDLRGNELALSPDTYSDDVFAPLKALVVLDISCNSHSPGQRPFPCRRYSTATDVLQTPVYENHFAKPSLNLLQSEPRPLLEDDDALLTFSETLTSEPRVGQSFDHPDVLQFQSESDVAWQQENSRSFSANEGRSVQVRYVSETPRLNYPDVALSKLVRLKYLFMDGLTNKTLGPGFARLTSLTNVDLNGKTGYCRLTTLNEATLTNLVAVSRLTLTECGITLVTPMAFSSLPNLVVLELSYNQHLGFDLLGDLAEGLTFTRLKVLLADALVKTRTQGITLTARQLRHFKNLTRLQVIRANFNRLEGVDEGVLCTSMPPNLQRLYLDGNPFQLAPYLNDMHCLASLTRLYVDGLRGPWTPPLRPPLPTESSVMRGKTCLKSAAPQSELDVDDEDDDFDEYETTNPNSETMECQGKQFSMPPQLDQFVARNFGLVYRVKKLRINATNALRHIDLSQNYLPSWQGPLCGFHNVVNLTLTRTQATYADENFFSSFPNLERLNISYNMLRYVFRKDNNKVFKGLTKLLVLDLSSNNIGSIKNATLKPLNSLEELYVTINGMATFDVSLNHMPRIHHLDLSQNQLRTLPKYVRDHLDRMTLTHNVTVNMTFNPIACTCENMDFLNWVKESKVQFGPQDDYYCQLQLADGSLRRMEDLMATIEQLQRTCGSYVGMLVGATACSVLLIAFLLMALAYRFRWKLRYLYYASRLALQRRSRQHDEQQFDYDAFVSFASDGSDDFVQGELREHLEDGQGLRLCIHTRDFMPGKR
jgi:Leucine-rich repeat (LRR) protein